MTKSGFVYLVGAGCAGADLITLRGMKALQSCDSIVYDDLIDPALLEMAPAAAERIYMGKRSGKHSAAQEEICAELIRLATLGHTVVRLKGGDPYVFGRGGEEMLSLLAAGIPCEEIPGISSAIAIPAAAGIPVTHRGLSRGVHIITGHTAGDDALSHDFAHLAALEGTLVFLMGLAHLPQITEKLMAAGKDPMTPAAVLSGGNAFHHAALRGTLKDIAQKAREAGVTTPAVIVIGAVATMDLTTALPLAGCSIGLTGTAAIAEKLSPALRGFGADVRWAQRHRLVEIPQKMANRSFENSWLVFTSSNGVQAFFRQFQQHGIDRRRLHRCKFAVIGRATEKKLWEHGYRADLCPAVHTSEALGEALASQLSPGEHITLLRSAQADELLFLALRRAGFAVEDLRIYDVQPQKDGSAPHCDYLIFASAGGVNAYWDAYGEAADDTTCVCIGPVTAKALARRSPRKILMAPEISAEGILRAILDDRR